MTPILPGGRAARIATTFVALSAPALALPALAHASARALFPVPGPAVRSLSTAVSELRAAPTVVDLAGRLVAREPARWHARSDRSGARRSLQRRETLDLLDAPADRPQAMLAAIRTARALRCRVTQNPAVGDPPRGSHVASSKHYQRFRGTNVGRAIDVYCSAGAMLEFFRWAERNRERIFLDDLFYDPIGYSYDAGRVWGVVIGGHAEHVHLSI